MKRNIAIIVVCLMISWNAHALEQPENKESKSAISIYEADSVMTLEDAIARAKAASPRMKSAAAGVEAAKGAESQAGYWPNPEVSVEAENIAGGGKFGGADVAEFTYGINQQIEIGGKRAARQNAARAVREVASSDLQAEYLNLIRDIHIAYTQVLAQEEALKLAIEQEKIAKNVLATVTKRVDAAAEPDIQRSKAEVAFATSVIAREREGRQLAIAKANLARLWGASELDVLLDRAYFFTLEAPQGISIYREKLDAIPDVRRHAYMKAEKESLLALEKSRRIPDPNVSVGVRDYRETGDQAFVFSLSIPLPILHQNEGTIGKARAEVTQVYNNIRQMKLMLEQELTENWQQWNMAFAEANHIQRALLPSAEKAFSLARSGYEKGKFTFLEVLDAQRTLFDARAQYYDALKRYHWAHAWVDRLTNMKGVQ